MNNVIKKVTSKVCTKCKTEKLLSEFNDHHSCRFGVNSVCKKCKGINGAIYNKLNKKKSSKYQKEYYKKNKDKKLKQQTIHRKNNKDLISAKEKKRYAVRIKNPKFRLDNNISRLINFALKGNKNRRHWEDLVGYTSADLRKRLEGLFKNGMNWENYGSAWHVDHIIPRSVFNYTKPEHEDFKKCWALNNLQPMLVKENLSKKDKLYKHFQPSLLIG